VTEHSAVVYCLVPPDLRDLSEVLNRHFHDYPDVEVLTERRSGEERRSGKERRSGAEAGPERRTVLAPAKRRPPLPDAVARYADRLAFVELREDEDAAAATEHLRDRVKQLEGEVDDLLGALVRAADDLRGLRTLSPRRFLAARRVEQAIERQRRRGLSERE